MYTIVIKANNKTLRIAKSDKSLLLFPKIFKLLHEILFSFWFVHKNDSSLF